MGSFLAVDRYGFLSEGSLTAVVTALLPLLTLPSERGPGESLGGKPISFRPAPAPGEFISSCSRWNSGGEEGGPGLGGPQTLCWEHFPDRLWRSAWVLQGFWKRLFTLCGLLLSCHKIFKPLICVMDYVFTCQRSPTYSPSICLIEERPNIAE